MRFAFKVAFPSTSDYANDGVGLAEVGFDLSTNRYVQVGRNGSNWFLETCDGTTASQSTAAGADGSFHEFEIVWRETAIELWIDGVQAIVKSTNLPDRPMFATALQSFLDIRHIDWRILWDIA
jgi:hypothetical protein